CIQRLDPGRHKTWPARFGGPGQAGGFVRRGTAACLLARRFGSPPARTQDWTQSARQRQQGLAGEPWISERKLFRSLLRTWSLLCHGPDVLAVRVENGLNRLAGQHGEVPVG